MTFLWMSRWGIQYLFIGVMAEFDTEEDMVDGWTATTTTEDERTLVPQVLTTNKGVGG